MNLTTPTTSQVYSTMMAQIELSIGQTIPILPKAFIRVFAKVFAGVFITLWKYAGSIFLQLFVRTAQYGETTVNGQRVNPLVEWGRLIGVGDPDEATPAELVFDVTVTTQSGTIPSNTQIIRSDTGVIYLTTASVALNAATVQVSAVASGDPDGNGGAGEQGNLQVGDSCEFVNPIANVRRTVTVASVTSEGADAEDPEDYRVRIIRRFQRRPQGGAYSDYRAWAEDVGDVVNVFPYRSATPGEIDLYVEVSTDSDPDGIPSVAQLSDVQDAIEYDSGGKASRRPVGAAINYLAISRKSIDVEVNGLDGSSVAEVEDAIETAVDDYLRSREPFILGLSVLPRKDRITLAAVSGIVAQTAEAMGHTIASVTMEIDSVSEVGYELQEGELAKLGNITFT